MPWGSEFGSRNLGEWLEAAGGDPLTALVGKLAPYFGIFVLLLVVAGLTIHRGYEVPFRGSAVCDGGRRMSARRVPICPLGALLQLLARNLAFGLSLTGIVCSPAFGFAGVGFPILAMGGFAQVWGLVSAAALVHPDPVSTRRRAACRRSIRSKPFAALAAVWRWPISALRCFGCDPLPANPRRRRRRSTTAPPRTGLAGAFVTEYGRVPARTAAPSACSCWRLSSMACSTLSPISTAGSCRTDRRRRQRLIGVEPEHHPGPECVGGAGGWRRARARSPKRSRRWARREVFAILDIPAGTERDVLAGRQARLPAYVDSVYFLLYNRTLQGILEATGS